MDYDYVTVDDVLCDVYDEDDSLPVIDCSNLEEIDPQEEID